MTTPLKSLADLDGYFVGYGGQGVYHRDAESGELVPVPRREGIGLSFQCPCGCGQLVYVDFANPLDGGAPVQANSNNTWDRSGDKLENITLHPSIQRMDGCKWHGYVENGMVRTV